MPRPMTLGLLATGVLLVALPSLFFGERGDAAVPAPAALPPTATVIQPAPAVITAAPVADTTITALTLSNPRAELHAEERRITAELDVKVEMPGGIFQGKASISGGIRPEPKTMQFFLADPVLDRLEMATLPADSAGRVKAALTPALEQYFRENPVYNPAGPVAAAVLRVGVKAA